MTMTKSCFMKTAIYGAVAMLVLFLGAAHLTAQTVVKTLGGGPLNDPNVWAGYSDGNTASDSQFNTPCGIAVDISGTLLVLADRDNNLIRIIDLTAKDTYTFAISDTSLLNKPIGVAVDSDYNVFVLNYGNGNNGSIYEFDSFGDTITNKAVNLPNVGGITLDNADNIYATVSNNTVIRITSTNTTTTITNIPIAGTSLQGIILKRAGATAGLLAVCDFGRNGIYLINPTNGVVTTNAGFHGVGDFSPAGTDSASKTTARFNQPMSLAETSDGSLIVADYGNNRVKVVSAGNGSVNNLYGVPSSYWVGPLDPADGIYPGWWDGTVHIPDIVGGVEARQTYGLALAPDGTLYVTENYYDIIRAVTGSGFVPPPLPATTPTGLSATPNNGQVSLKWTASSGATSYNIKRSTTSGGETTIANVTGTSYTDTGGALTNGATYYYVVSAVGAGGESPNSFEIGVTLPTLLPPTGLAATTNFNQVNLTWTASSGAASYNIKRSTSTGSETFLASSAITSYSDTNVANGTTYFYVVSAVNFGGESVNSSEISITVPIPPPSSPTIGWFDYEGTAPPVTVFYPVSGTPYITHNDLLLAIEPNIGGVSTYYSDDGSNPINGKTPPSYQNGVTSQPTLPVTPAPDLTIKAVNVNSGGSSAIVTAEFIFQVANPIVIGTNAAQFIVTNITTGALMYYTIDGSVPNQSNYTGTATNGQTLNLSIPNGTNLTFEVVGYKANYQPSTVVTNIFSQSNYVANTISFGFTSGEASSAFIASPGEIFVAPVTLTTLPGQVIYSLQFNMVVTNAGPNPGPAPVLGGYYTYNVPFVVPFQSMLMKPIPGTTPVIYTNIPPAMFDSTTLQLDPLLNRDDSENLVAVGWLERAGETNLYNTLSQNLITYSLPHDDLFPNPQQPNGVVVGGYSFTVPLNATPGQTYQIRIGLPSATSDGVGAPGNDVFIYAPTNGSLTNGSLNSIKNVTIGSVHYLAGDSAPFRWFNAGDFGDTNLDNADVEQVFQSAAYGLNYPPLGSDFFDSMDSAGAQGADYGGYGYLQKGPPANSITTYGNNNDLGVNDSVFGDGTLDVSDLYATFRRSLDPSLKLYSRFWTNDTVHNYHNLVAVSFARSNLVAHISSAKPLGLPGSGPVSITNTPSVNFASTDFVASAGQVLHIPVTAKVFGSYPLRVAMLNISVVPLDGSPALTLPISFTPNGTNTALGTPTSGFTASDGINNYCAAWLDSTIAGISNSAVIGTLTVTIPTNATSLCSYAIHFDHASGSPNGAVSFPRQALTGLITLSSRTNSTYNDGIPDSWRLRYFGTVNNYLSVSNADADGTGMDNWQKYVAGLDPTDPKSKLTVGTDQAVAQNPQDSVIYWPSVAGKQYVIQRSASLFPGTWNSISTNTGTGGNMEIHDSSVSGTRYYRVSVQ